MVTVRTWPAAVIGPLFLYDFCFGFAFILTIGHTKVGDC